MRLPRTRRLISTFFALTLTALLALAALAMMIPATQAWTHWLPISPYGCINPDIAADPFGGVYVVWERERDGEVFLARRHGGTWLSPVNLSNSPDASRAPRIAADARGWLHVVWAEGSEGASDIYYTYWNRSAWAAPRNLSQSAADSQAPAIATDSADRVHVVWVDRMGANRDLLYTAGEGASWTAPLNLSNTPGRSEEPDVAPDANGNVYVAWQEGMPAAPDILLRYLVSGQWSDVVNVSHNPSLSRHPALAGDRTGRMALLWEDNATGTSELHVSFWSGEGWSEPTHVVTLPSGASAQIDALVDTGNVLHVLWDDLVVDQWEIYYIRWNGTAWSTVQDLSHNWGYSFRPALALDAHGLLHAVWQDSEPYFPHDGIVHCWQAADSPLPAYPTATPTPTSTSTATATPAATPLPQFRQHLPVVMHDSQGAATYGARTIAFANASENSGNAVNSR